METSDGTPVEAPSRGPSTDVVAHHMDGSGEDSAENSVLNELLYCISSFHAVVTPVTITMILSALAVVFINTEETRTQGEEAYAQTYQAFELEEGNSTQNFAASLANVLIIVSVICVMTFLIVILYKYGCTKIFLGYMIVVMTMLLGYSTSVMALVAINKYGIRVDKISFVFCVWNYTIVGVLAIFFNRGIPKLVTQGYLVSSSAVLAWQLSYFNAWTAWTLLAILALYDLFAVLSPYGPLRKLTELMSRPGARPLPGLLYEATLPSGVQRPNGAATSADGAVERRDRRRERRNEQNTQDESRNANSSAPSSDTNFGPSHSLRSSSPSDAAQRSQGVIAQNLVGESDSRLSPAHERNEENRGYVALAIAKLYNLDVIDQVGVLRKRGESSAPRRYSAHEVREIEWTPRQLRAEVTVYFPHRGGRIVASEAQDSPEGKKYLVYNRNGELLRTFLVNREGKVLQVVRRERDEEESPEASTIKLGLGDFIFYSVLVSKAAQQSYTAFVGCTLTILCGLGGTLVLLAVHGKALPALPISIFLAMAVFVLTTYVGEPFVRTLILNSLYV